MTALRIVQDLDDPDAIRYNNIACILIRIDIDYLVLSSSAVLPTNKMILGKS